MNMKKKLLASLVIIASAQSNAAIELHNSENVNLTLSGSAEVQYHKDSFNLKEKKFYNQDAKIRFDDGDLAFLVTTPISNTMKGFAGIEFNFKDKKTVNDGLYVGVKDEKSTLTAGRTVLLADDSGVGVGYESELGFTNQNGENTDLFMTTQSDQVIKYKYDNKSFWAGVSYSTDDEISSKKDKKTRLIVKFTNLLLV
ncbi:hypothetical protein VME_45660 [Vibrio harveyi 1DA3]|nr:hypothetical protein VME_45660 [Vibrio harveyi 1DA3]